MSSGAPVITFTTDFTQARSQFEAFIQEISRRPVPIQFAGGGAASQVGASNVNAPGFGGGTVNNVANTANSVFNTSNVTSQLSQLFASIDNSISNAVTQHIRNVQQTIDQSISNSVSNNSVANNTTINNITRGGGGGGGGGFNGGSRLFRYAAFAAFGTLARIASGERQIDEAEFQQKLAITPEQSFRALARETEAAGSMGGFFGWAIDKLDPNEKWAGPNATGRRRQFETQAEGEQILDKVRGQYLASADERMERLAYGSGGEEGRRQLRRTQITSRGADEQTQLQVELSKLNEADRLATNQPRDVAMQHDILRKSLEERIGKVGDKSKFELQQFDDLYAETRAREGISSRTATAISVAELNRKPLEATLAEIRGKAAGLYAQRPSADRISEIIDEENAAAVAAIFKFGFETQTDTLSYQGKNKSFELLLAHQPLQAKINEIINKTDTGIRNLLGDRNDPQVKADIAARLKSSETEQAYARQSFGEETFGDIAKLNISTAGLNILSSGNGQFALRKFQQQFSDLYGSGLTQAREAYLSGRPSEVNPIQVHTAASAQALFQEYAASIRPVEADLRRTATSDPSTVFDKVADILAKIEDKMGTLDDINTKLDKFNETN